MTSRPAGAGGTDQPVPATAAEAADLASAGNLAEPVAITVKSVAGEKYDQIVGYRFADEPPPHEPIWDEKETAAESAAAAIADEEVPF